MSSAECISAVYMHCSVRGQMLDRERYSRYAYAITGPYLSVHVHGCVSEVVVTVEERSKKKGKANTKIAEENE